MKQFACGDVVPGCGQTFTGETEDDILGQVAAHAAADHDLATVPPEVVDAVKGAITEV